MPDNDSLREAREAAAFLARSRVEAHPELARALVRDDLVVVGKQLWEVSYRHTQGDQEAFGRIADMMGELLQTYDPASAAVASSFLYMPMEQITMFWAARWADQAFPVFQLGHKYAAALLATSVTVGEESIKPPFRAFLIEVPQGLLSIEDGDRGEASDVRYVLAHYLQDSKGEWVWNYAALTTSRVTVWFHGAPTAKMLEQTKDINKEWADYSFALPISDRDERVSFLLQRLVLNTCLAASSPDNVRALGKTARMSPGELRGSPEPIVRTYQIGKPITLDCREAVRDYIEGKKPGRKLSVQVLVAGHWKSQPHGPKNSLRKTIWREPYWRGPDDAPILTRPHKLDDDA